MTGWLRVQCSAPLPWSNYPYVGRLGSQGEVSFATQGANVCSNPITGYLQTSVLMHNVVGWCRRPLCFYRAHEGEEGAQLLHNSLTKNKSSPSWDVILCSPSCVLINNTGADGDLRQTPLARWQEARPGCRSGCAGIMCPCGWPGAKVGWWTTWCGGSWCLLLHSRSASSPQTLCLRWCCLYGRDRRRGLITYWCSSQCRG